MTTENPKNRPTNERIYYLALTRIANFYASAEELHKIAEKSYGLSANEAIELAYENIRDEARLAIKGKLEPKK